MVYGFRKNVGRRWRTMQMIAKAELISSCSDYVVATEAAVLHVLG